MPTTETAAHGTAFLYCEARGTVLVYVWRTDAGARLSRYFSDESTALTYPPK